MKNTTLAIIGFSISGLGYSVMVPVIFSRAARNSGNSPSFGIASVATAGYAGFLIGPVIIGILSENFGLNLAFSFLIGLTIVALMTEKIGAK